MTLSVNDNRRALQCRACDSNIHHRPECPFMESRSATREVQDWQRRGGEKLPHPDGWTQRAEYKP